MDTPKDSEDPPKFTDEEFLAISDAIIKKDIERVRSYLGKKRCVKNTLLLDAVKVGDVDIIKMLLDYGYNVNLGHDKYSNTPLHIACKNFNAEIIGLLFSHGANPCVKEQLTCTSPIELLATHFCYTLDLNDSQKERLQDDVYVILETFFDNGLVLSPECEFDHGVVHQILKHGTKELVRLFARRKYDFRTFASSHPKPSFLHTAAEVGNVETAEELLKHMDINSVTDSGCTPLHVAAYYGQDKCAELFMKYDCKLNLKNGLGRTPLCTAFSSCVPDSELVFERLINFRFRLKSVICDSSLKNYLLENESDLSLMGERKLLFLTKHLIKMKALKCKVPRRILSLLLENDCVQGKFIVPELEDECEKEIERMKETMIGTGLSMYRFMVQHEKYTAWYVNDSMKEYFKTGTFQTEYPLYYDGIQSAYLRARRRRGLINMIEPVLSTMFLKVGVPSTAIRIIIDNLSKSDLAALTHV